MTTRRFETMVAKAVGAAVRVDAGPVGLVFYGADPSVVSRAVESVLPALRSIDTGAKVSQVGRDEDEEPALAFFAVVSVAWARAA